MKAPMTLKEWRALDKNARARAWRHWTTDQRLAMYGQFAAVTPGDSLPYPDDYNDPADSPLAFRELAEATQTALNNRVPMLAGSAPIAPASGYVSQNAVIHVSGQFVITEGAFTRETDATISINGTYTIGTIPVGFWPASDCHMSSSWKVFSNGADEVRITAVALMVGVDGKVWVSSNFDGMWRAAAGMGGDYCSVAGMTWKVA